MPLQFEAPQGDPSLWLAIVEEEIAKLVTREIRSIARDAADLYWDSLTAAGDYGVFDVVPIRWNSFVDGQLVDTFAGVYSNGSVSTFLQAPGSAALPIQTAFQWAAVVNTDAVAYARTMPNRMRDVGDHLWNDLTTKISAGIESGDVRDRLRTVIQETGEFSAKRAETIARTEVTKAYNAGSLAGAQALGEFGPVEKVWISGLDGRVRDSHLEADGQYVPIDADFTVGGSLMSGPGDGPAEEVVNCRCSMLFLYPGDTRPDGTVVSEATTPEAGGAAETAEGNFVEDQINSADAMRAATRIPTKINTARHGNDYFQKRMTRDWQQSVTGGREMWETLDDNDAILRAIMRDQGFDAKPTVLAARQFDELADKGWTVVHRGLNAENNADLRRYVTGFVDDAEPYVSKGLHGNGVYTTTIRETAESYAETSGLGIGSTAKSTKAATGHVMDLAIHPNAKIIDAKDLSVLASRRLDEARTLNRNLDERWPRRRVPDPYEAGETIMEKIPLEELRAINASDPFVLEADRVLNYVNVANYAEDVGKMAAMEGFDIIRVVNPKAYNDKFQIIDLPDTYYVILNRGAVAVKEFDL